MNKLSADIIREKFLAFFASRGHAVIASDSVVPKEDPTVLFTTAGMQQFKRQFLGYVDGFTRAATSQKCVRTDDLDEVGKTNVHHTFFEMLGNFSFGDYFKKEAIAWAWEFLTGELGIPESRLWVSVYYDDQEAWDIWKNVIGIPEQKIFKLGDKSNFWPSNAKLNGPNGPCGPCSEIFFDYRPESSNVPLDPDDEDGRFAEIWNLVFTQFNRKDGGELEPLPNKNIDTGMGLERLCAVMQGVKNNFDTDLFVPIIREIESKIPADLSVQAKRIIADHIRAAVFAINDGIIPSNKERGSVVKSLINRSINMVLMAGGRPRACVFQLVGVIADTMRGPYPELGENTKRIADLIEKTEEAFIQVWQQRVPEFQEKLKAQPGVEEIGRLFFLYQDTFGLPLTASMSVAQGAGIPADMIRRAVAVYDQFMVRQKEQSRAASKMAGDVFVDMELDLNVPRTVFAGYETFSTEAEVLRIFQDQASVSSAEAGAHVRIVLDQTPFYAESGGQVGDTGCFMNGQTRVTVKDTRKLDGVVLHSAVIESGKICAGDHVTASVDQDRRQCIMRNHTATHLLQAALRKILGEHVQQQGSAVDEKRLRFDFTHPKGLTDDEKTAVENEVNRMIQEDIPVEKREMTIQEARDMGALAFFAEKYGDTVRVVRVPGCSVELCGGTHVDHVGEIRSFRIISESAIAQGIRRIEAATAALAESVLQMKKQREMEALEQSRKKALEKENTQKRFHDLMKDLDMVVQSARDIQGSKIVAQCYDDIDINLLRRLSDSVRQKAGSSVILFGARSCEKAAVIVSVSEDLISKGIQADQIVKVICPIIDGSGGGRPQFAQAGGRDTARLSDALQAAQRVIVEQMEKM